MNLQEHRTTFRPAFTAKAGCSMDSAEVCTCRFREISMTGRFLETVNSPVVLGKREVEILLNGLSSLPAISHIKAETVRPGKEGAAISFHEPLEWMPLLPMCESKAAE